MKRQIAGKFLGVVLLLAFLPLGGFALAQTEATTDAATDEGITAIPNSPDDYNNLQAGMKKDRLADALRRIQALEQENRFQTRRIEKLERDVNDLRNNNSSRVSI